MPAKPTLSVIIVNYNGADFLKECIDSLLTNKAPFSWDIWVVDNKSSDGSISILENYGNKINLIKNTKNQGFSYANNQAAKASNADYYFLLNSDTVLTENVLEDLMTFLNDHPDAGAITPKLCNADGSLQAPGSIWGQWRFLSKSPRNVPFIAGAAVMFPKKAYWDIGGLDEQLFFYNDDIDMCKMLPKKGYTIYYVPTVSIVHYGGLSTKYRRVGSLIEGYRGGIYLSKKHYGNSLSLIYRFFLMIDIIVKLAVHGAGSIVSKQSREFFMGYLEIARINLTNDVTLNR